MTVGAFLLVLGPLVMIHELGHYVVARWFGVKADVFSVGFGKELLGWTDRRGTRWKIGAVPLGGYVQFAGDLDAASTPDPELAMASPEQLKGTFLGAPLWQKSLIVLAGPVTNLVLAVLIFAGFNFAYGVPTTPPVVEGFSEQSTAQAAGIKLGDRIVAIDGKKVETFSDIVENVALYPGRTVAVAAQRDGVELVVPVRIASVTEKDEFGNEVRRGLIGVRSPKLRFERQGPVDSLQMGVEQSAGVIRMMVTGIGQIFTGERSVRELGGPLKIAKFSGEQFSLGWLPFVSFVALISINLGFINLLPIPALDGGHLAFYAAEAVRRKPLDARSQEWAFRTGFAFVLALMLFATINDLASLLPFGR